MPNRMIDDRLDNVTLYSAKPRNPTQVTVTGGGGNNDNSVRFRRILEK